MNIKPFEEGSFIVEILLFAQTNYQSLVDLINSTDATNIKQLLEWLGLISSSGVGLVGLIKWLKGKPPKKVEKISPNEVRYTNYTDNSVNISLKIDNLYQNSVIHNNFYNGFGKLIEKDGIASVESYIKDDVEETKVTSTKEDLESFKGYSENPIEISVDEIAGSEYETHL